MSQRGSDKWGPRIDQGLEGDTDSIVRGSPVEARAQEARKQEPPGNGEPEPGVRRPVGVTEEGMTPGDVEARSELARVLEPSVFPARRDDLVEAARRRFAPDDVLGRLSRLPDRTYGTVGEVWDELAATS
jgi:hypothetical protein